MSDAKLEKVRDDAAAATGRAIRDAVGQDVTAATLGAAVEGALGAVARIVWERRGPRIDAGEFRRRVKAWAVRAATEASRS